MVTRKSNLGSVLALAASVLFTVGLTACGGGSDGKTPKGPTTPNAKLFAEMRTPPNPSCGPDEAHKGRFSLGIHSFDLKVAVTGGSVEAYVAQAGSVTARRMPIVLSEGPERMTSINLEFTAPGVLSAIYPEATGQDRYASVACWADVG